jgi:hypothetical protein
MAVEKSATVPHPSEDFIERYSLGHVAEKDCVEFEEHILTCHFCQDRLAETDEFARVTKEAARIVRRETPKPSLSRRFWPVWVVAFATFAIAIALPSRASLPSQELQLTVSRGSEPTIAEATRGRRLTLTLDVAEVESMPRYSVEVVDGLGSRLWNGMESATAGKIHIALPDRLRSGTYWVRLYVPSQKPFLLREYGFRVL